MTVSDYDQRYVDLAEAEWERGATVFAPRLPLGAKDGNEVGQLVEAIEAIGWHLEHYTSDGARMCPLFRRPA